MTEQAVVKIGDEACYFVSVDGGELFMEVTRPVTFVDVPTLHEMWAQRQADLENHKPVPMTVTRRYLFMFSDSITFQEIAP